MVKRSQRVVAFLAAVIILFEVAAVPQKAKAVALTASVVASVAAIMTACGVSYWAASQTDAIDYLGGKIDDYLGSLETVPQSYEDWLGINASSQLFEVVSGGVMRFGSGVANKVLDFVRWFNTEEGVESGGSPVGASTLPSGWSITYSGAAYSGSWSADLTGVNTITVTLDGFSKASSEFSYMTLLIPVSGNSCMVRLAEVTGTPKMSVFIGDSTTRLTCEHSWDNSRSALLADGFVTLRFQVRNVSSAGAFSGTCVFKLFPEVDVERDYSAQVAPSSVVAVPNDLAQDDDLDVTPSVGISQGMSVEEASSEIFDGVTSADGLTSTGETADSGEVVDPPSIDLSGILEFLGSILNAILAIPGHIAALPSAIASAFNSILSSIKSVLDTISEKVTSVAQSIIDGINTKLDNFIYKMEFGLSGVVSSIQRIGQNVRDMLMMWLDDFITDVQSAIDTIKQTVIGIPQNIAQAAQDLISGIQALPGMISDALTDLFVPDEAYVEAYVDSLVGLFEGRVGILTYPLALFVQFLNRFAGIEDGDHTFRWGAIHEPFSGREVIAAGSYDLDDAVASSSMSSVYSLYLIVVKAIVAFWFLHLCHKKYELIINRH